MTLAQFGHHPDPLIDAEVEVGRLGGLLAEAHGGLLRALDYRAATPEGVAIKHDVRDALLRTGFEGTMGIVGGPPGMTEGERGLHNHYASNALAQGHAASCEKVTASRNWPRLGRRVRCTCAAQS